MNEKTKKWIKIISGVLGVAALVFGVGALMGFLNMGCISAPERIEGEPPICGDAKYIAYAFHKNDKVPETVISNGMASCRNQHIYNFCENKVSGIEDKNDRERAFQVCWDKNKAQ